MRAVLFMDMEDNTSSDSSVNNSEVLTSEAAFTNVGNSVLIATIQDFTPFLIPIDAGQDIILRLTSFCQTRNQVVYILSAVGYVIHPSIHVFNRRLTFECYTMQPIVHSIAVIGDASKRLQPNKLLLLVSDIVRLDILD
ncbi:uncharacterized protein LOC132269995 [Cornus florida]|uniref:uncharacterized protein LOC132269995 n=1 Tax=Cornus florida TaxID=4283 RepID=UPI0028A2916E|nr:uncharacterized protein LOC132269995 [Cornus florida]